MVEPKILGADKPILKSKKKRKKVKLTFKLS